MSYSPGNNELIEKAYRQILPLEEWEQEIELAQIARAHKIPLGVIRRGFKAWHKEKKRQVWLAWAESEGGVVHPGNVVTFPNGRGGKS